MVLESIFMIAIFFVGIAILLKGSSYFTEYAAKLAKRIGVSEIVIGITVVAVASTLPELTVSFTSMISGSSSIALGNVVGSNIANIGLILGIAAVLASPIVSNREEIKQSYILLITTIIVTVFIIDGLSPIIGLLLYTGLVLHFFYILKNKALRKDYDKKGLPKLPKIIASCAIGAFVVIVGAQIAVYGAIGIARTFSISETVIGLTIVSIGTSLPELANCITASLKKLHGIALGNIIGANMLNLLLVLGTSAMVGSITPDPVLLTYSIPFLLIMTFMLVAFLRVENKLTKIDGMGLLAIYFLFLYLKFFVV